MQKIVYIIPGLGETCRSKRYKMLGQSIEEKGYTAVYCNPDWYQTVSSQIFKPEKDSIIIGFSFGAVIAYLIARKFKFKKVIFASLSPLKMITHKELLEEYRKHMSLKEAKILTDDVLSIKINLNKLKTKYVALKGSREEKEILADYIVQGVGHRLDANYIESVIKLI